MINGTNPSLPDFRQLKVNPIYHPGRANYRRPGQTSSPAANTAPGKPAGKFADDLKLALAQQRLNWKSSHKTARPL